MKSRWRSTRRTHCLTLSQIVLSSFFNKTYAFAWTPSAWVPILRSVPSVVSTARRVLPTRRRSFTALRMSSMGPFGSEDAPGESAEEKEARAVAEAARRQLERMWSSSPSTSTPDGGVSEMTEQEAKLQAELDKRVVEDRRENPFPTSSEEGSLEAAAATQKALVEGKKGLIIDVEVRQMDETHEEFDADLLIHFVGEVSKALAMMMGRTKVMYKGDTLAARATLAFQKDNEELLRRGIDPRHDLSFCSYLAPTLSKEELEDEDVDPDRELALYARKAATQFKEEDELLVVVGPRTPTDVVVLRRVLKAARGFPVVVINPRMSFNPRAMTNFDTTYLLRQFAVIPIKTDPRDATSPLQIFPEQRNQEHVTCELGQFVPKVLVTRSFPDDFKLYIDLDGLGFKLMKSFERKPMIPILCLNAQVMVDKYQREQSRKIRLEERRERERMWARQDEDDDEDEDGDREDSGIHIVNRRMTKAEKAAIDAQLRD